MSISTLTSDWRFVQLVAGSYLDPALAQRYAAEPRAVLAEFGLELAAGELAPTLTPTGPVLVTDRLVGIDTSLTAAASHFCWRAQARPELQAA